MATETDMAAGFLTETEIDKLLREAEERLSQNTAVIKLPSAEDDETKNQLVLAAAAVPGDVSSSEGKKPKAAKAATDDVALRKPELKQSKKDKKNPEDAGPNWFGLPRTVLTPAAKRDFQVLRMRGIIDAKHHFRKDTRKDLIPKFSAFGTIVEGPMEGRGSRLTRKERRQTIAEEVLASEQSKESFKKRYNKVQEQRTSGRKAFYKKLVSQRRRRP